MSGLNLVVVSDIHAFNGDPLKDDAPSYYSILPQFDNTKKNPFASVADILKNENLPVDWVVCAGDLADRADPASQAVAWRSLAQLKSETKARLLVGTVGNHDVDSRFQFDIDTKGALQSLIPPFPGFREHECDFYWSRNFVVYEETDVLLVVLNSAAFHGINSDAKEANYREYLHGRVSNRTIDAILQKVPTKKHGLNILLTHHHFFKNERLFAADESVITNGTKLLDALSRETKSCWFVLHGHQHFPNISYGPGDNSSPVIFSAGSFSRKLNELARESANQFYHINFPFDEYASLGLETCGSCRAWDWVPDDGWQQARGVARIPHYAGFGCRNSPTGLASRIAAILTNSHRGALDWSEVASSVPELRFVLPSGLDRIRAELETTHNMTIYGKPFLEKCQICKG